MNDEQFRGQLNYGYVGEDRVKRFLIDVMGLSVLVTSRQPFATGKGPRIEQAMGQNIVASDLSVFGPLEKVFGTGMVFSWIEVKRKSAFTFYNRSWQTGIDIPKWDDYLKAYRVLNTPIWILFLHEPGHKAINTPDGKQSPSGLFGNSVDALAQNIDHKRTSASRGSPHGMVYWRSDSLVLLGDYDGYVITKPVPPPPPVIRPRPAKLHVPALQQCSLF